MRKQTKLVAVLSAAALLAVGAVSYTHLDVYKRQIFILHQIGNTTLFKYNKFNMH